MRLRKVVRPTIFLLHRELHDTKSPDRTRDQIIQDRQNSFSWYRKHTYRPYQHFTYDPCSWSREAEEKSKTALPVLSRLQRVRERMGDHEGGAEENLRHTKPSLEEQKETDQNFSKSKDDPNCSRQSSSNLTLVRRIEDLTGYLDSPRFEKYTTEKRRETLINERKSCIVQLFLQWIRDDLLQVSYQSSITSPFPENVISLLKSDICIWCLLLQHKDIILGELENSFLQDGNMLGEHLSDAAEEGKDQRWMSNMTRKDKIPLDITANEFLPVSSVAPPPTCREPQAVVALISENILKPALQHHEHDMLLSLSPETIIELFSILTDYHLCTNFSQKALRRTSLFQPVTNYNPIRADVAQNSDMDNQSFDETPSSLLWPLAAWTPPLLLALQHALSLRQRMAFPVSTTQRHQKADEAPRGEMDQHLSLGNIGATFNMENDDETASEVQEEILSSVMVQLYTQSLWRLCTMLPLDLTLKGGFLQNEDVEKEDIYLLQLFGCRQACQVVKSKAENMSHLLKHSLPSPPSPLHQLRAISSKDHKKAAAEADIKHSSPSDCFSAAMRMLRRSSAVVNASPSMNIPCRGKGIRPLTDPEDTTLLLESMTYIVWMSSTLFSEGLSEEKGKQSCTDATVKECILHNTKLTSSEVRKAKIGGRKLFQDCFEAVMEALYFTPNYDLPPDIVVLFCSLCLEEGSQCLLWDGQELSSPTIEDAVTEEEREKRMTLLQLDNLYHILLLLSRLELQLHVTESMLCRLFWSLSKRGAPILQKAERLIFKGSENMEEDSGTPMFSKSETKKRGKPQELALEKSKWLHPLYVYVKECKRLQGITLERILSSSSVQAKHLYGHDNRKTKKGIFDCNSLTQHPQIPWEVHFCCYTKTRIPYRLWVDACRYRGVWPTQISGIGGAGKKRLISSSSCAQNTEDENKRNNNQFSRDANGLPKCSQTGMESEEINKEIYGALIEMRSRSAEIPLNVSEAQCLLNCLAKVSPDILFAYSSSSEEECRRRIAEKDWRAVWLQFPRLTYPTAISSLLSEVITVLSRNSLEQAKVMSV